MLNCNPAGAVWKPQKFCETIYARMAELVLGSTPAGTPGVVDGAARDRRLRQLAAIPSAALAQLTATPR
jgi:hypothetical protein